MPRVIRQACRDQQICSYSIYCSRRWLHVKRFRKNQFSCSAHWTQAFHLFHVLLTRDDRCFFFRVLLSSSTLICFVSHPNGCLASDLGCVFIIASSHHLRIIISMSPVTLVPGATKQLLCILYGFRHFEFFSATFLWCAATLVSLLKRSARARALHRWPNP